MWEIIGHERAIQTLCRAIESGHLSHALLITGPAGIGRMRLGIELAKTLNCTADAPPCQSCVHCRQIEHQTHPDVTIVGRAEGKDSIAIQQIRVLRDSASLRPFQGSHKVYLIEDAESLTEQAADALLKTLEEPQPSVTVVLVASDVSALPGTVLSRCTLIQLRAVSTETLVEALRERGTERAVAERITHLARGNVGWALRAAKQPAMVAEQEEFVAQLRDLPDLGLVARLRLAESLSADRKARSSVRRALELLATLARDLLLVEHGLTPLLTRPADLDPVRAQAERLGTEGIVAHLGNIRIAMQRVDQNVDPRLALEAMMIALP